MAVGPETRVHFVELAGSRLHGQEMNQLTNQAPEEQPVIERLVAVSHLFRAARVVQKHDVEIGTVRQLEPAELAISNDAEAGRVRDPVHLVTRLAVTRGQVEPRNPQRLLENRLRKPCQTVAHFHDRQRAAEIRDRNTKHHRALILGDCLHTRFAVTAIGANPRLHLALNAVPRDRIDIEARIEQLVEQHRQARDLPGNVVAARAQVDKSRQYRLVFIEQREVGTAPEDAPDDAENPRQRDLGMFAAHDLREESWYELLQTFARHRIDLLGRGIAGKIGEDASKPVGPCHTLFIHQLCPGVAVSPRFPGASRAGRKRRIIRLAAKSHLLELTRNGLPVAVDVGAQLAPSRILHRKGQPASANSIVGQIVGLLIGHRLDEILETPQETIRRNEFLSVCRRQAARVYQQRQHFLQLSRLQTRFAAAAHQLQRLDDKFGLADAAGAELDVVLQFAFLHLGSNQRVHFAQ